MSEHPPPLLGEPLPVELANTHFAWHGQVHDGLGRPGDLAAWLQAVAGRLPFDPAVADLEHVTAADLREARGLRDALRVLLAAAAAGQPLDGDAARVLGETAARSPHWTELKLRPEPIAVLRSDARPVRMALAAIAEEAAALVGGAGAEDVRACPAPDCMLFFRKDHPRRSWCSPRCADRARSARYYARRRAGR